MGRGTGCGVTAAGGVAEATGDAEAEAGATGALGVILAALPSPRGGAAGSGNATLGLHTEGASRRARMHSVCPACCRSFVWSGAERWGRIAAGCATGLVCATGGVGVTGPVG